jgi:hypothetical protein
MGLREVVTPQTPEEQSRAISWVNFKVVDKVTDLARGGRLARVQPTFLLVTLCRAMDS